MSFDEIVAIACLVWILAVFFLVDRERRKHLPLVLFGIGLCATHLVLRFLGI